MPRVHTVLRKRRITKTTLLVAIFVIGALLLSFRKPQRKRCTPLSTESYCPQPHQCVDSTADNQNPRPLIVVAAGGQRAASTFLYNALRILLRIRDPNTVSGWYVDLKHLYQTYAQAMPRNGSDVTEISAGNRLQAFQSVGSLLVKIHTVRDWHDFLGGTDIEPEMENIVDAVYTSHRDMRDAVRSIRDMGWGVNVSPYEMAEADYCRRMRRRRRPRQFFRREEYAREDTWVTVAKSQIICREALIEAAGSKLRLDMKAENILTMDERKMIALLQEMSRDLDYAYSKTELELAAKELRRLRSGRCDSGFDVEMSVNPVTHLHKGHVRRGDDEEAKKGKLAIGRDKMKRAPNRSEASGELAAVLDASLTNGHHEQLDDTDIKQLADEQELSRKRFDDVLAKSSNEWRNVSDPQVLADALVAVLDQIRGPALTQVGPEDPQNISHPQGIPNGTSKDVEMEESSNAEPSTDKDDPNGADEKTSSSDVMRDRAKYIPLRLSQSERKILRLVEAALNVSEYTDVVDVLTYSRMKTKQRINTQVRDLCSILIGLAVAMDYKLGQKLVADRSFADNESFFQDAFEISRRHKIANPEKSRDTYGKLIHMLQDSASPDITRLLEFSCVRPLETVSTLLEERGGVELLEDPLIQVATMEIIPDGKSRRLIQKEIQQKERAVTVLAKRYKKGTTLSDEDIRRCLYSIGDNNAYLRAARDPCDTMIKYLHNYFKPERPSDRGSSLAIQDGSGGARLTHDHVRQFRYVFQSLALWREICHEMFKLWYLSEQDLLDPDNTYHLRNTGQGLNRVQAAPNVSGAMYEILSKVKRRVGSWVGSSVVHLGDYNVPNALTFIDKYAQVQRILGPLVTCIRRLEEVSEENSTIGKYITDTFGGVEPARKLILKDFFRHAFDGSGASDWFSAGSCIDGRLTSAWNWCSEIERKPYWPLFLLTGFTGFDGDF